MGATDDVVREQVGVYDARTDFATLLDRAAAGEEIVITRHGEPVAMLGPPPRTKREPRFGWSGGDLWIADDFDAPMEDEHLWYAPLDP